MDATLHAPDPIGAKLEEVALRLYHPGSRPHLTEWTRDEKGRLHIGVSTAVKGSATAYARRIIEREEDDDEHDGFYGAQGNAMARAHFSQLTPYRENQVRIGLDADYDYVGHVDAIIVLDGAGNNISFDPPWRWPSKVFLCAGEHKMQDCGEDVAGGNIDLADRQAKNYAAMLRKMLAAGVRHFTIPDDFRGDDPDAQELRIPDGVEAGVWGTSLHFWPRNEPRAFVRARPLPQWEAAQVLDRYVRKATAIIASARAGDTKAAMEWDQSAEGCVEFKEKVSAEAAGLPKVPVLAATLQAALFATYEERWCAEKKRAQGAVLAAMAQAGQRKLHLANPDDEDDIWAAPTFRSNVQGTTWLTPNLRGNWDERRLVSTIENLLRPTLEVTT